MRDERLMTGDRVEYRGAFLRSCGWYTSVPRGGTVVGVQWGSPRILRVEWDHGGEGMPERIRDSNLVRHGEWDPN